MNPYEGETYLVTKRMYFLTDAFKFVISQKLRFINGILEYPMFTTCMAT